MITVLPALIVSKVPVTLFITLLVNAMKIRRVTNTYVFACLVLSSFVLFVLLNSKNVYIEKIVFIQKKNCFYIYCFFFRKKIKGKRL